MMLLTKNSRCSQPAQFFCCNRLSHYCLVSMKTDHCITSIQMGNGCSADGAATAESSSMLNNPTTQKSRKDDQTLQEFCVEFKEAAEVHQLSKTGCTVLGVAGTVLQKLVALDLPFPVGPLCSLASGVVGLASNLSENFTEAQELAERIARVHFTVIDVAQKAHLDRHAKVFGDILTSCRKMLEGFYVAPSQEELSLLDRIKAIAHSVSADTKAQIVKLHEQLNQLSLDTALAEVLTVVPAMQQMHREIMGMLADLGGTLDKVASDAAAEPTVAENLQAVTLLVMMRMQERLGDVSVPLHGSRTPSGVHPTPMMALVDEWLSAKVLSPTTNAAAKQGASKAKSSQLTAKRKPPSVLLIKGGSGSGKSHFAHSLVQRAWGEPPSSPNFLPMFLISMQSATDADHMISVVLRRCGVSEDSEKELKRRPVVFVLDALDEWPLQKLIFTQTDLQDWPNAHVLVTTRPEFLQTWGERLLSPNDDISSAPLHLHCVPFSSAEVQQFVESYTASLGRPVATVTRIQITIETSQGLAELCSNPFVLSRVVAMLIADDDEENSSGAKVAATWTRSSIYGRWIAMHERREIARLQGKPHTNIPQLGSIVSALRLALVLEVLRARSSSAAPAARDPSLKSALAMFDKNHKGYEFIEALCSEKRVVQDDVVRTMPLRLDGDRFTFQHESVFEFLVSQLDVDEFFTNVLSVRLLHLADASLIRFLGERVASEAPVDADQEIYAIENPSVDHSLRATLWKCLTSPASAQDMWPVTANALTILIVAKHRVIRNVSFDGLNLKGAILDGAVLQRCTFRNANLDGVSYHNVRTHECDFSGATFSGALREKLPMVGHSLEVNAVRFSPDGQYVVSCGSDGNVVVWEASSGGQVRTLQGHSGKVNDVCFSPSGDLFASCDHSGAIRLWVANNGTLQHELTGHTRPVKNLRFSPDGTILASCGTTDLSVRLWDVKTGASLQVLLGHTTSVEGIHFNHNAGQLLSFGWDGVVRIWDMVTGFMIHELKGHQGRVACARFSPDGLTVASCGDDKEVRLWVAATGHCLHSRPLPNGHQHQVNVVCFSPDSSMLVSCSWDNTVRMWDVASGAFLRVLEGHSEIVSDVLFSPDGRSIASCSWDRTIMLWDAASGALAHVFEGHTDSVETVVFSPDGHTIASCSPDKSVRMWDTADVVSSLHTLRGHTDIVTSVSTSCGVAADADGVPAPLLLLTASPDQTVRVWRADSGALESVLRNCEATSVVFDSTGHSFLACGWGETFRRFRFDGSIVEEFSGHTRSISCASFRHDDHWVASCSADGTVRLWECGTASSHVVLLGHAGCVDSTVFSPDGRRVASCGEDKTIRLWDHATHEQLHVLEGHTQRVSCVRFSPDGRFIASSSWDKSVRLWGASSASILHVLSGHGGYVECLAFSPDSRLLASCGHDATVRLWNLSSSSDAAAATTPPACHVTRFHSDTVRSVCFSRDGKHLASCGRDIVVVGIQQSSPSVATPTTVVCTITTVIGNTAGSHWCDAKKKQLTGEHIVSCPMNCSR